MKAELVPENGDPPIPILRDVTVVGRHPDCDVVIDQVSLSKRHCVFVKTDGLLVIRDLATTNGTKVKGQKVRWAALLPDDKISLGGYKVRIYLGSDEMPSPSEQRQRSEPVRGEHRHSRRRRLVSISEPGAVHPVDRPAAADRSWLLRAILPRRDGCPIRRPVAAGHNAATGSNESVGYSTELRADRRR